jgi:hypothetical protein
MKTRLVESEILQKIVMKLMATIKIGFEFLKSRPRTCTHTNTHRCLSYNFIKHSLNCCSNTYYLGLKLFYGLKIILNCMKSTGQ